MTAHESDHAVRKRVLDNLSRLGPQGSAALRRSLRSTQRDGLAEALAELIVAGRIRADATPKGIRYSLIALPPPTAVPNNRRWCQRCLVRRRRATGLLCGSCLAADARGEADRG